MSRKDNLNIPEGTVNEQGPAIVPGPATCSFPPSPAPGGCCPPSPPCPGPGGGGAYVTQVYASKENDGGVEVTRRGSAVSIAHKKYDTDEVEVASSDRIVSDIEVQNGHVTKIETVSITDEVKEIVDEVLDERLDEILPDKMAEVLPDILPDALVEDDTLKDALLTNDILWQSMQELNFMISGGRAPHYDD